MSQAVRIYTPQNVIARQKRWAIYAWSVIFSIALIWVALIISAPVAKAAGFASFSNPIYKLFSYLCHQMPERSFYLEQNPLAVCARCFGFYGGFLLGIFIYPFFRTLSDTEPLPRFWLFAAMIPMGIDWSLTFFNIWENTHLSRLLTGLILGGACAFFIVPAVVEISYFLGEKFQRKASVAGKFNVD